MAEFTVTREWIESNRTPRGGFTYAQMRALGYPGPVTHWLRNSIGMKISFEQKDEFEQKRIRKNKSKDAAIQNERKLTFNKKKIRLNFKCKFCSSVFKRKVGNLNGYINCESCHLRIDKTESLHETEGVLRQLNEYNQQELKRKQDRIKYLNDQAVSKKSKPAPRPPEKAKSPAKLPTGKEFYDTREWKELRYMALKIHGARCQCCGASRGDDVQIHVDHVKPRYTHPELSLDISNLQILCGPCNIGKGAWDQTDWRNAKDENQSKIDQLNAANEAHLRSI